MDWLKRRADRLHQKHFEKHRKNEDTTRRIDRMMVFIGTMGPLATFVQVVHIFAIKTVAGISLFTWIGYIIVSACWFIYGFFYKNKPVMIVNSLSLLVNSFIIIGIALYH